MRPHEALPQPAVVRDGEMKEFVDNDVVADIAIQLQERNAGKIVNKSWCQVKRIFRNLLIYQRYKIPTLVNGEEETTKYANGTKFLAKSDFR